MAITYGNTQCIRKNLNHPSGYCGIHRSAFCKNRSKSKIGLLSDLCDTILKFPKIASKSYMFNVQRKPLGKLLKRGSTVNFLAKNEDNVIEDKIVLFKDMCKSDIPRFISLIYDINFESVNIL